MLIMFLCIKRKETKVNSVVNWLGWTYFKQWFSFKSYNGNKSKHVKFLRVCKNITHYNFLTLNKIGRIGRKEKGKASLPEYQGFNHPQLKDNQIRKHSLWRILWNKCFWKLGTILTKACKEIQYLGKLCIAIGKPLPLKQIPLQIPLTKFVISVTAIL